MVCETLIKKIEERIGRKLTSTEKKKVEEKMHHSETSEHKIEEEAIAC